MRWSGAPEPSLEAYRAVHETASLGGASADPRRAQPPGARSMPSGPRHGATTRRQRIRADGGTLRAVGAPGRHRAVRARVRASPDGQPVIPAADGTHAPSAAPGRWRPDLAASYREFRDHLTSPLFRNGYALMVNTGATGLLGVVYWLLAARHYSAVDVGRASAAYSAMNLVSGFTAASIVGAVTRFIPQSGRRTSALVLRAYLFSSVTAVIAAVLFLLTVPHWGESYAELRGVLPALFFTICVIAWGIFTLQDGVLMGLRSAVWVPVENGTFGVVKIALLLAFAAALPSDGHRHLLDAPRDRVPAAGQLADLRQVDAEP